MLKQSQIFVKYDSYLTSLGIRNRSVLTSHADNPISSVHSVLSLRKQRKNMNYQRIVLAHRRVIINVLIMIATLLMTTICMPDRIDNSFAS